MGYSFWQEKFKKNWVRAIFILENGQLEFKTCIFDVNNSFKKGKCCYIVEQKLIKYEKHIPYLVYMHDNPNPVSFIKVKHIVNGKVISSENFNDILDSKVIKEMVASGMGENLLLILICVVILLSILNLAASSGMFSHAAANATANITANMSNATIPTQVIVR